MRREDLGRAARPTARTRKGAQVTQDLVQSLPRLYLTAPSPCPYLAGRLERKMFTQLAKADANALNSLLTQSGFRRSQNIAYRPACEGCSACISVRIVAREFEFRRGFARTLKRNADIERKAVMARATEEQFALLRGYLDSRHDDGGMADMALFDYRAMVELTDVDCQLVEYRLRDGSPRGRLVGVSLTDTLEDGQSMVYSFYDTELEARSLGTFMVLDHVREAHRLGFPHVYLGYWVRGSRKMAYKSRFRPMEALTARGWEPIEKVDPRAR
ncbi:MAG: arginyltransferase [Alphaproteobacteria bacterium]|nr:arginyltransferase [Alphaproteobacteria bacterium]